MRVALDYRPALSRPTGVGRYVRLLARHLLELDPALELILFSSSWRERLRAADLDLPRAALLSDHRIPVRLLNFLWHRWRFPPTEALFGRVDLTHAAHPLPLPNAHGRRCVTLHDLYFLDHPEHTGAEIRRDYARQVERALRAVDAVIVPSAATRARALARFELGPERIRVIPHGVDPALLEPPTAAELAAYRGARPELPERFILFVGTLEPRKNVALLLRAYAGLRRRHPAIGLVLAGAAGWGPRPELPAGCVGLGYVAPGQLRLLYHAALALALPSLDEGFGLPALEAMACGCPVVVSSAGALPEVVGAAGLVLDPHDAQGWSDALAALVESPARCAALSENGRARARGFSWERAAAATLALYRELVER
ncbi:MAG TPA: glycosyltransferase family 1 protein [Acidobacteriota bacterium]